MEEVAAAVVDLNPRCQEILRQNEENTPVARFYAAGALLRTPLSRKRINVTDAGIETIH